MTAMEPKETTEAIRTVKPNPIDAASPVKAENDSHYLREGGPQGESLYINRELSWLAFNQRVLEEAWDERHPLLERIKFLAIFSSNLDEFFMIRVSGLQVQRKMGVSEVAPDGYTPAAALDLISERVETLMDQVHACWSALKAQLLHRRIDICHYNDLSESEKKYGEEYFREVFPILTPLAVDHGHPFPHISNLSINLLVVIEEDKRKSAEGEGGGERFARMKIPANLPRLIALPSERRRGALQRFVWIEDIIAHHIGDLFPGLAAVAVYPFRITRDADIEIQEDEASDLLQAVQSDINKRHFGFVTRLEVTDNLPEHFRKMLIDNLDMDPRNLVAVGTGVGGEMGLASLMELLKLERPEIKDPPFEPRVPALLARNEDIFSLLKREDVLLYHPYDTFDAVLGLVKQAAYDPNVRAIKQTLYRLGSNSPLVPLLIEARDDDTQVSVLVELKARFDEANNIQWASKMEEAGIHVVYGLPGLKTHCKVFLIVRQEAKGLQCYVHLSTGNYNAGTARVYTDFGFMTSDKEITADVVDVFNYLTGYSNQKIFRKLWVAPINLRQKMAAQIEQEAEHAKAGRPASLIFQMNALVDPEMICLLYRASQAGVKIDLLIRGICCLRPGLKGISDNIHVYSIVGRFLEHSRVYYFANGGDTKIYLGSADLMQRNLDRRVEVVFPIEKPKLQQSIYEKLQILLSDNIQAREMNADGSYTRRHPQGRKRGISAQNRFIKGEMSAPTNSHRKRS